MDGHPASDAPQLFAARYSTHPQRTPQASPPSASEPVVSVVVCAHRDNITRWQLQLAVDNVKAFSKSTENEAVLAECIGGAQNSVLLGFWLHRTPYSHPSGTECPIFTHLRVNIYSVNITYASFTLGGWASGVRCTPNLTNTLLYAPPTHSASPASFRAGPTFHCMYIHTYMYCSETSPNLMSAQV